MPLTEHDTDLREAAWRASVQDQEGQPVYPNEHKPRPSVAFDDTAPAWADMKQAAVWEN